MNAACRKLVWLTGLALLGACTVGPDYVRPVADKPVAYKEMDGWKTAQPRDQELRGKWWEAYNDALLNGMMEQVSVSNQNLVQAAARGASCAGHSASRSSVASCCRRSSRSTRRR